MEKGSQFVVESMDEEDWEQVRSIYAEGIATGHATFETEVPSWDVWKTRQIPETGIVARSGDEVLGWAALSRASGRSCYSGVAEVSVYVAQKHRGKRVGQTLLAAIIALSERRGLWTVQAGVFPENKGSIALHKKMGFREVGRRERLGRTHGVWKDVVLLERRSKVVGTD